MERSDQNHSVGLHVAVEAQVFAFECGPDSGGIERAGIQRHPDRPELASVVQIDLVPERDLWCREAFFGHYSLGLSYQIAQCVVDRGWGQIIEGAAQKTGEVLAQIGMQHANGTQGTGIARHIDPLTSEPPGDDSAVHRSRPASCNKSKASGRVASFD